MSGIVFALVVWLAYPDGHTVRLQLGDGMTAQECYRESQRAAFQLAGSLSVARLLSVSCEKGAGA